MDSAAIVGLMRRQIPGLRTYTLRFPDVPGMDEAAEATETAHYFACQHTVVDVTGREVEELLPRFASDIDQPSVDGFNTWLISRAAARDVKGVLSGLGGDEWFAGYPVTSRMNAQSELIARADPGCFRARRAGRWQCAGRRLLARTLRQSGGAAESADGLGQTAHGFPLATGPAHARRAAQRKSSVAALRAPARRISHSWRSESPIGLSCLLDVNIYLRSQLLRDADATSMAHSLELRVPFVDQEVATFARSCSDSFKLSSPAAGFAGSESCKKLVLRRALARSAPAADRPATQARIHVAISALDAWRFEGTGGGNLSPGGRQAERAF